MRAHSARDTRRSAAPRHRWCGPDAAPSLGLFEIGGLRRHHEDRIQALNRHDPDHAGEWSRLGASEDLIQLQRQFRCGGVVERKQPERHPAHPVDVENRDQIAQRRELIRRFRQQQEVALRVHPDGAARWRERFEQRAQFSRRDKPERHHLHTEARRSRVRQRPQFRHRAGRQCLIDRHHLEQIARLHESSPVHAQDRIEHRHEIWGGSGRVVWMVIRPPTAGSIT